MAFIEPMHRNKPNITYLLTQYCFLRHDLKGQFQLTSAGWRIAVQPPGICTRFVCFSCKKIPTSAVSWIWALSRIRKFFSSQGKRPQHHVTQLTTSWHVSHPFWVAVTCTFLGIMRASWTLYGILPEGSLKMMNAGSFRPSAVAAKAMVKPRFAPDDFTILIVFCARISFVELPDMSNHIMVWSMLPTCNLGYFLVFWHPGCDSGIPESSQHILLDSFWHTRFQQHTVMNPHLLTKTLIFISSSCHDSRR